MGWGRVIKVEIMVQAENVLQPSVMLQASQLLQELGNLTVEACDQQQLFENPLLCDSKTPGDLKEVNCAPCDDQPARLADTLARGGGELASLTSVQQLVQLLNLKSNNSTLLGGIE